MKPTLSHTGRLSGPILCPCGEPMNEGDKTWICINRMCKWFGKSFTTIAQRAVLFYEVDRKGLP